jgi:hypothetical protein
MVLGREIRREIRRDSKGLNNKDIYVKTEYLTTGTSTGKVYRVSEPYFSTSSPNSWAATYTYDIYGRTATVTTPMWTTSYGYNSLTATVTTPESTKSTTLNSSGLTQSSTVNGKTVNYTYLPQRLDKL